MAKKEPTVTNKALAVAKQVAIETTPLLGPILRGLERAADNTEAATESGELSQLNDEANRQSISLKMSEMQARVAQELAIAERIQNAQEVEIEEYYEGSGKGSAGLTTDAKAFTLGLAGEGKRVTKRIYRFTGNYKLAEPSAEDKSKDSRNAK